MRKLSFGWKLLMATLLFVMCDVSKSAAQHYERYFEDTVNFHEGDTFEVKEFMYDSLVLNPSQPFRDVAVENMLILKVNEKTNQKVSHPYTLTVELDVFFYDSAGNTSGITPVDLSISYHPDSSERYNNRAVFHTQGAHRIVAIIKEILPDSLSDTIPVNVVLEGHIYIDRVYDFTCNDSLLLSDIEYAIIPETGEIAVSWTPVFGAVQYDLEWTYVTAGNILFNGDFGIDTANWHSYFYADFKDNASKITTAANSYKITNVFPDTSLVVFRVRAIGRDQNNPNLLLKSKWSFDVSTFEGTSHGGTDYPGFPFFPMLGVPSTFYCFVLPHEDSLNWQYNAVYAEEGKKKEVVSYFDGAGYNRQTVTKTNTNQLVLVQETKYDSIGRPAVNFLPVPSFDSIIRHYDLFNVDYVGQSYTWRNFEKGCGVSPDIAGVSSGASRYYSTSNPQKNKWQAYLPDAEGIPFTQTKYMPDARSLPSAQAAPGDKHKIGSGHETKYFLGTPEQEDLDKLFGTEAGNALRYSKEMVVDANGQINVTYKNLEDKPVATALAGDSVAGMQKLTSNTGVVTDTFNLDVYNVPDTATRCITSSRTVLISNTGFPVTFFYKVSPQELVAGSCDTASFCYDCLYDFEISITNDCGNHGLPDDVPFKLEKRNFTLWEFDTVCGNTISKIDTTFQLAITEVGSYYITKRLCISEEAITFYRERYISENTCLKPYSEFLDSALANVNIDCGEFSCAGCVAELGSKESYILKALATIDSLQSPDVHTEADSLRAAQEWEDAYQFCNQPCATFNYCNAAEETMLNDLRPGGQYARIYETEGGYYRSSDTLSVLNANNFLDIIHKPSAKSWRNPATPYLDQWGQPMQVEWNDTLRNPQHLPDSIFIAFYQNNKQWAKSLLPYHPEYRYLEFCRRTEKSATYQQQMLHTFTYKAAVDSGYFNPLNDAAVTYFPPNTGNIDPYFTIDSFGYNLSGYMKWKMRKNANYMNDTTKSADIWTIAVRSVQAACNPFNSVSVDSFLQHADTATLDRLWQIYRGLYLSLRQRAIEAQRTYYAIAYEGYCGCIGSKDLGASALVLQQFSTVNASLAPAFPFQYPYSAEQKYFPKFPFMPYMSGYPTLPASLTDIHTADSNFITFYPFMAEWFRALFNGSDMSFPMLMINTYQLGNDITTYNYTDNKKQLYSRHQPCNAFTAPFYAGYSRRFPDMQQVLGLNLNQQDDESVLEDALKIANDSLPDTYAQGCEAMADQWLNSVSGCIRQLSGNVDSASLVAQLRQELINVCKLGTDMNHPFGSSTAPPGKQTAMGNRSFEDVLKHSTFGFVMSDSCNINFITFPVAYHHSVEPNQTFVTDTCLCDRVQTAFAAYNTNLLECDSNGLALDTLQARLNAAVASGLPDSSGTIYLHTTGLNMLNVDSPAQDPNAQVRYNPLRCNDLELCDTFVVYIDTFYRQQEPVSYTLDTIWDGDVIDTILVTDLVLSDTQVIIRHDTVWFKKLCNQCDTCSFSGSIAYNKTKQIRLFRGWKESNWGVGWNEYIGIFEDTIMIPGCGKPIALKVPVTFGDQADDFDSPVIIDDSIFGANYYGHIRFQHPASGGTSIGTEAEAFINNDGDHNDSAVIKIEGNFLIDVFFNTCEDFSKPCDTCITHYRVPVSYRDTTKGACATGDGFGTLIPYYVEDCDRNLALLLTEGEVPDTSYENVWVNDLVLHEEGFDFEQMFGWGYSTSSNVFHGYLTMLVDTEACSFVFALEGTIEGIVQSSFGNACEDKPCNICEDMMEAEFNHFVVIDTNHILTLPDGHRVFWHQDTLHFEQCGRKAVNNFYLEVPALGDTITYTNVAVGAFLDDTGYFAIAIFKFDSARIYFSSEGLVFTKAGKVTSYAVFSDCDSSDALDDTKLTHIACQYSAGDTTIVVTKQFLDADFGCPPITPADNQPCHVDGQTSLDFSIPLVNACGNSFDINMRHSFGYPNCGTASWSWVGSGNWIESDDGYLNVVYHEGVDSMWIERTDGGCVDTIKITRKYVRDSIHLVLYSTYEMVSPYPPATAHIYSTGSTGSSTDTCAISLRPMNAPEGFEWSMVTAITNVQPDPTFTTVGGNQNFIATASLSGGGSITVKGTACTALEYCEVLNNAMSFHEYFNILYGTKLGCDDLSGVLCSCNDSIGSPLKKRLSIPDTLTCRRCITCPRIHAALDTFHARYPYVHDTSDYYATTLTNFLNREFGYVLTYPDYHSFLLYCDTATEPVQELCNQAPFTVDPDTACHDYRLSVAEGNAMNAYEAYMDSIRKDFEERYIDKCIGVKDTYKLAKPSNEYHYTLYYYDLKGNLIKTVPPAGVQQLSKAKVDSVRLLRNNGYPSELTPNHALASIYEFNTLDQNVRERSPDGGNKRMFYDALGRPVAVRDSVMLAGGDNAAQYTLYDGIGRVVETGIARNAAKMTYAIAKDTALFRAWHEAGQKRNLSRTYYDEPLPWVPAWFRNGQQENLRNRVASATWQAQWNPYGQNPHDSIRSYFAYHHTYDVAGNVKEVVNENRLLPDSHRLKTIAYDYDLISGKVNKVDYQPKGADRLIHRYEYDADNRLIRALSSRDDLIEETDAENFYYDHGALARVELGENKVQGLDYAYTIQGWVKGVNSGSINTPWRDAGRDGYAQAGNTQQYTARDAAGYVLGYYFGDYSAIGATGFEAAYNTAGMGGATNLYNGNIRNMSTAIRKFDEVRGAAYGYDQLNRLVQVDNYLNDMSNNSWIGVAKVNDWHERFKYDANGNILELIRRGTTKAGRPLAMDSVTFTLYGGTNRLQTRNELIDADNYPHDLDGSGTLFDYNVNGSVVHDYSTNNEYSWFDYNHKLRQAITPTDTLKFAYDALGNRNMKTREGKDSTFYVSDLQGNIMATYKLKNDSLYLVDQPLYGSSRLGTERMNRLLWQGGTNIVYSNILYGTVRGNKQLEISNHLGNVLVTVSDKKVGVDTTSDGIYDYYEPVEITATDYYAYGGMLPERTYEQNLYLYSFNGKMKDLEVDTGLINYGERVSDTRIDGRFLTGDPKKHLYPWNSPYANAENRPIDGFDANGEGWEDVAKLAKQKAGQIISSAVSIAVVTTAKVIEAKINSVKEKLAQKVGVEFDDIKQVKLREANVNFSANVKVGPIQGSVKSEYAVGESSEGGIGRSDINAAVRFKMETTTTSNEIQKFIRNPSESIEGSGLQIKANMNLILSDKPTVNYEAKGNTSVLINSSANILGTGVEGNIEGGDGKIAVGAGITFGAKVNKPLKVEIKGKTGFTGAEVVAP